MLPRPQRLGGMALGLPRAPGFLHGGMNPGLQVTHVVEMECGAASAREQPTGKDCRERARGATSAQLTRFIEQVE